MSPLLILFVGVAFVVILIAFFRVHPFFALILAGVLVGLLTPKKPSFDRFFAECCQVATNERDSVDRLYGGLQEWWGEGVPDESTFRAELEAREFKVALGEGQLRVQGVRWSGISSPARLAIEDTMRAFGGLAVKIAMVIVMAAVIGLCLMESGAADKITRRLLALLGERRANVALLGSGYFLSVPVFFDTVFFLLVPLARALRMRTGKNYLLYVMAICAGGAVTHSIVPPTPGPLIMVETLGMDLGVGIAGGFLLGLPVAILGGLWLPKLLIKRVDPPLRDTAGAATSEQLQEIVDTPEEKLPGFWLSMLPVALPVVLITGHSVVDAAMRGSEAPYWTLFTWTSILGDKHFALFVGTVIALWVLARQKGYSMRRVADAIQPAIAEAGVIILITCAGGAFGGMLKASGIGGSVEAMVKGEGMSPSWLLVIAWGVSAVMKVAQGSGTVAMITAASIMAAVLSTGVELPYHTLYVFAAIAFGSKFISWMNDSGFWVVCKMSGFTESETLKTWTVLLGFMAVVGLVEVLLLSAILPLK